MLFVSYVVVKDGKLQHSSLAISKIEKDSSPEIIFRIGSFAREQIILEDFIKPTAKRKFYHKTWPINEEQLTQLLTQINSDRRETSHSFFKPSSETVIVGSKKLESTPGSPGFNFVTNNCATYAARLLEQIGIKIDNSLFSKLPSIKVPTSRGLEKAAFELDEHTHVLKWKESLQIALGCILTQEQEEELKELVDCNKVSLAP